jgi:hypothetical protein
MANYKTFPYVEAFFPYRETAHRRADDIFAAQCLMTPPLLKCTIWLSLALKNVSITVRC